MFTVGARGWIFGASSAGLAGGWTAAFAGVGAGGAFGDGAGGAVFFAGGVGAALPVLVAPGATCAALGAGPGPAKRGVLVGVRVAAAGLVVTAVEVGDGAVRAGRAGECVATLLRAACGSADAG